MLFRSLKWLAAQAGLTYSAAKRAYAWLKKQGIITTGDKICEEHPDGTFSGRACAKLVSPSFFAYFGLSAELKAQRDWASGRLKEQPAGQGKQDPAQQEAVENMQHHAKMVELEKSNRQAAKQAEKQAATPAKPTTPHQLQEMLVLNSRPAQEGKINIVVLDCNRTRL